MLKKTLLFQLLLCSIFSFSQTGTIRGFVYDKNTTEPSMFTNVVLENTSIGAVTNVDGFFTISKVPIGSYNMIISYIGYDTLKVAVTVSSNKINTGKYYLTTSTSQLKEVEISAEREEMKTEIRTAVTKITPKQIRKIPTIGGDPDIAQYLQVLPGVVFTGDQGGQLYIRGGAPIHNKVLLDGMIVYNPFHSIGFFSVFDTDILRTVDVYSGGFNAEFGGRISSIMDITTRDGNKNNFSGKISGSTFGSKLLLEGPISKSTENNGGSTSFILTTKTSFLEQSSKFFYTYADSAGLPFNFYDVYAKISTVGENGSKFNIFGYSFNDRVNYSTLSDFSWNSYGVGSNFILVPSSSSVLIEGNFSFSDYHVNMEEINETPRSSKINGFNMGMSFSYFLPNQNEAKYGFEILGLKTNFDFYNSIGRNIEQQESTTEIAGFVTYKFLSNRWIIEPSFRGHYYASLSTFSPEPRLGIKVNVNEKMRIKSSLGLYAQNLVAANSDRDVVNLFYGFLSGSDNVPDYFIGEEITHYLQKSKHAIIGIEYDLGKRLDLNIEGYVKDFSQLTNINRNKLYDDIIDNQGKPDYLVKDFIIESGIAKGIDILLKYQDKRNYIWFVYSLGKITRQDEFAIYAPHFDRRHNVNLVASRKIGKNKTWELDFRWNLGSGFPFTQTQGFFEELNFSDGINTDYVSENGDLGIIYAELNTGRLPIYHRLDVSAKKDWNFNNKTKLQINFGITNTYNRNNIFYINRINQERVNQLPILPSLGFNYSF